MKLIQVKPDLYLCSSDHRLRFDRRRRGWDFHLAHSGRRQSFATLAEATDFARPLWRPVFISTLLDHLHGDGLRLWREAAAGDRLAFQLMLDWLDDHLPKWAAWISPREWALKEADLCGLFCPRRRRVASGGHVK